MAVRRQQRSRFHILLKAVAFQVFSMMMTFLMAFLLTHNMNMSLSISMVDLLLKVALYYIFEVSWTKLFYRF